MDTHIAKIDSTLPDENHILVPKDQLTELLRQNKEAKDDKAALIEMLASSVDIIGFMKSNFLNGHNPSELSIPKLIKIITKLPMKLSRLSDEDTKTLSKNFEVVRAVAAKFLDENQLKQISDGTGR